MATEYEKSYTGLSISGQTILPTEPIGVSRNMNITRFTNLRPKSGQFMPAFSHSRKKSAPSSKPRPITASLSVRNFGPQEREFLATQKVLKNVQKGVVHVEKPPTARTRKLAHFSNGHQSARSQKQISRRSSNVSTLDTNFCLRSNNCDPLVYALDKQDASEVNNQNRIKSAKIDRNIKIQNENKILADYRKNLHQEHLELQKTSNFTSRPGTSSSSVILNETKNGGILHKRRSSILQKKRNDALYGSGLRQQIGENFNHKSNLENEEKVKAEQELLQITKEVKQKRQEEFEDFRNMQEKNKNNYKRQMATPKDPEVVPKSYEDSKEVLIGISLAEEQIRNLNKRNRDTSQFSKVNLNNCLLQREEKLQKHNQNIENERKSLEKNNQEIKNDLIKSYTKFKIREKGLESTLLSQMALKRAKTLNEEKFYKKGADVTLNCQISNLRSRDKGRYISNVYYDYSNFNRRSFMM